MRKIEEVLRLSAQGKSVRVISRETGVSRPSVATYLEKAAEHEIGWPLPAGMDRRAWSSCCSPRLRHQRVRP